LWRFVPFRYCFFAAMILLEKGNRILGETVSAQINMDPEEKVEPIDVRLSDFDDTQYRVIIEPENKNVLLVAMSLPCFSQIDKFGARDAFERVYKGLTAPPFPSYDLTIKIDMTQLKEQKQKDEMVEKVACFKANVMAGVFDYFFSSFLSGAKPGDPFKFDLRSDTTVFFFPKADRVTVIFSVDFKERVDRAIAKIFMQEFVEARRTQQASPSVQFGVNPPLELSHYKITEPTGNLGFISFAVQKIHLDNNKKDRVISVLQVFRNYMQYHIKCSKSFFHQRMRARVASLLTVLNRAKVDPDERLNPIKKKTASGRTFKQQP